MLMALTVFGAVAGALRDERLIRRVDAPGPAYILREKGAPLSRTDITRVEGRCFLNDTIGRFCRSEAGKAARWALLDRIATCPTALRRAAMTQSRL